jgi:hypothetical protein
MLARLYDVVVSLKTDSPRIHSEWAELFAPFAGFSCSEIDGEAGKAADLHTFQLDLDVTLPAAPAEPDYQQAGLAVSRAGAGFDLHLAGQAHLHVSPAERRIRGVLTPAVLDTYGAFEDVNATALAPLLRRRGKALIHAFAAACEGAALLLVGDNATGKSTTGLALLAAGWKLIANDSPMLARRENAVEAFAFPGLVSLAPDGLRRIPGLAHVVKDPAFRPRRADWKIVFPAENLFPAPWQSYAPVRGICFLELDPAGGPRGHSLESISPAVALGRLLPQSVDRWDSDTLAWQIDLLTQLAHQAPAFVLHLGPDVPALPGLLADLIGHR